MTSYPSTFPWQVLACIGVLVVCTLAAVFAGVLAVCRRLGEWREPRPGFVIAPASETTPERPFDWGIDGWTEDAA